MSKAVSSRAGQLRRCGCARPAALHHVGLFGHRHPGGDAGAGPRLDAALGEHLYVHGSAASHTLRRAGRAEVYRSVVVFGRAEQIESAAHDAGLAAGVERPADVDRLTRR